MKFRPVMMRSIVLYWLVCSGISGFKTEKKANIRARASSCNFSRLGAQKGKAKWVVAAELVETSKLYARCVARIEPTWLERIAGIYAETPF